MLHEYGRGRSRRKDLSQAGSSNSSRTQTVKFPSRQDSPISVFMPPRVVARMRSQSIIENFTSLGTSPKIVRTEMKEQRMLSEVNQILIAFLLFKDLQRKRGGTGVGARRRGGTHTWIFWFCSQKLVFVSLCRCEIIVIK